MNRSNDMNSENELRRLESFVQKLLKSFQELKEENGRLSADLQARNETILNLKGQLAENDNERVEISSRVSNIIEQIEEWEINLGEEVFDEGAPVNDSSRQGNLFSSVKSEVVEVRRESEAGTGYGE